MTVGPKHGAVFFDRDGVLNEDVGYLHQIEAFRWMAGAQAALQMVCQAGLLAIVVTNQSGVARGFYDEADVAKLHAWMQAELVPYGAKISAFYTCPYLADAVLPRYRHPDHPDRKPNPGMILQAMRDWNIDPARALIVGDRESDIEAGRRAGIAGLLHRGGGLRDTIAPHLSSLMSYASGNSVCS